VRHATINMKRVLHPARHIIGHFGDELSRQSLTLATQNKQEKVKQKHKIKKPGSR